MRERDNPLKRKVSEIINNIVISDDEYVVNHEIRWGKVERDLWSIIDLALQQVAQTDVFKEQCHFSKTGWAWSLLDGGCTCRSCPKPESLDEILPAQRQEWKYLFTEGGSMEDSEKLKYFVRLSTIQVKANGNISASLSLEMIEYIRQLEASQPKIEGKNES